MDILIVEPLEPEVVQWLEVRFPVRMALQLARQPLALRRTLAHVRAMIVPASVAVDQELLRAAPKLLAIGRLSNGAENIDADACAAAQIEIVRPTEACAQAEAEFAIAAMLQLLRRVPIVNAEGLLVGRELGGATVGLIGMTSAAQPLARLLGAFGAHVVGYDPALHASEPIWRDWGVQPLSLRELASSCDVVCVLMSYYSRYRGLIGERYTSACKSGQILVSLAHSSVFDDHALATALATGTIAAAWFDSLEPGLLGAGRALHGTVNLQVSPRVASTTRESRIRSAWAVARRIDALLSAALPRGNFRVTASGVDVDLADERGSG